MPPRVFAAVGDTFLWLSLEAIAAAHMSGAVGVSVVSVVSVYLALGLTGLTAALLSIYALAVRKQE